LLFGSLLKGLCVSIHPTLLVGWKRETKERKKKEKYDTLMSYNDVTRGCDAPRVLKPAGSQSRG
jgi:hypothetical protein